MRYVALLSILIFSFTLTTHAQYKSFKLSSSGDTLNAVDKKGLKQGKWVTSIPEIRETPGYDEEGIYKDDKKEGVWRKYTSQGDIIAIENYKYGGKDGEQKYFTFLGELEHTEEWHSYNPASPYDTIPVYGVDGEVSHYNIQKASQYSVPNGTWVYYDPSSGETIRTEKYDRGLLLKDKGNDNNNTATATTDSTSRATARNIPKDSTKPPEVLQYEKKLSKKKRAALQRTGQTGL